MTFLSLENTLDIIKEVFQITDKEIADCMHICPSSLSKLRKNKAKDYSLANTLKKNLYETIFNPISDTCPMKGEKENYILAVLTDVISTMEFKNVLQDVWPADCKSNNKKNNEYYKEFVNSMLRRTRNS